VELMASLRGAQVRQQRADQEESVFSPGYRSCLVMPSDGLEGLSRPSVHFEGLLNMFGWPPQCAGNVIRHAAFASLILMEWLEIHRHVVSCNLLEDLVLLDSV
jgi:hypothetical protein